MGKQRHTAEQIIGKLREAEVLTSKGMPIRPHSSLGYRPPAPETHAFLQVANA